MAGTHEVIEVGKDLLCAGYIARRAFNLHPIRLELYVDVEPFLHDLEVLIPSAKQIFDPGKNLNTFFHKKTFSNSALSPQRRWIFQPFCRRSLERRKTNLPEIQSDQQQVFPTDKSLVDTEIGFEE